MDPQPIGVGDRSADVSGRTQVLEAIMLRIPSLVCGLAIVSVTGLILPRSALAVFAGYAAQVNSTILGGNSAPYSVSPIPISGSFGAKGFGSASIDRGIMKGSASASSPVTGSTAPQIDVDCVDMIQFYDTSCPSCPANPVRYPVVLHTRLTGRLQHSGSTPYIASIRLYAHTTGSMAEGTATLDAGGLTTTGFLSGVPADMDGYVVDVPLVLNLASLPSEQANLQMEIHTGGTASGTEVSTAAADFGGMGWQVEPIGPVFGGLPAGVTVDVPSLNIENNHWRGTTTGVTGEALPGIVALHALQNPTRGLARLSLSLPTGGTTRVDVFDVHGSRVATLVDGWQPAGSQVLEWDASRAQPGIYFAHASNNGRKVTARLVVVL